tara:strand:- start:633 stop:779 length:147 start_codon:yes stop_codon:yes gene_type:complete
MKLNQEQSSIFLGLSFQNDDLSKTTNFEVSGPETRFCCLQNPNFAKDL